jgi:heat shock protein HslJ
MKWRTGQNDEELEMKTKDLPSAIMGLCLLSLTGFGIAQPGNAAEAGKVSGEVAAESQPAATNPLANTQWQLVEFQSMDDAVGKRVPQDPGQYRMHLHANGQVTMQLNCNRGMGTWQATPAGDGTSGQFGFGPLATTRALCPPPSMDESIAADTSHVRSYLLKDGRLYLSLMADAGIYTWEPAAASE